MARVAERDQRRARPRSDRRLSRSRTLCKAWSAGRRWRERRKVRSSARCWRTSISHPLDRRDGGAVDTGWCATRTTSWCCADSREEAEAALSGDAPMGGGERPDAASGQDAGRRLPADGARLRLPRLPVRSGPALGAASKSLTGAQGQGIRAKTRRTRGDSLERIIADLNPMLRGWFGYFKHAHHAPFADLDGFMRRRLRALLRKQHKRPGFGRCQADHQRWPNAFFAEAGLFTL